MEAIQKIALDRAAKMLRAAGVTFAIRCPDGTTLGTPEAFDSAKAPGPKRRSRHFVEYVTPKLLPLTVGLSTVIPYGDFDTDELQRACSSHATKLWGNGNAMTHKNAVGVEVLRLA